MSAHVIRHPPGWAGWLAVAVMVGASEAGCRNTLTSAYRTAPLPVRIIALAGWAVVIAHLHSVIPAKYDPFDVAARYVGP